MIPAGLTCGKCQRALYPDVARLHGETYVHVGRCPCLVTDCGGTNHSRGYCNKHYARLMKHGDPLADVDRVVTIEMEDVEWLAATGENLIGAAARLGAKSDKALEAWLRRQGRMDLVHQLAARNPRDWNGVGDGSGVSKKILGQAYVAKEQRRNETRKKMRAESRAA